ncbi:SDR family oxidoreductase [Marinilabiliaceae bacterium ANBcel2]|nr:SDR family oxidoreductase [Marinilabiliaceae bacterium ANBcel2]
MRRIVINGANGYVASNFINELLKYDYEIIALVRGNEKYSAKQKMYDALTELNEKEFTGDEKLQVYSYSLNDENFALKRDELSEIFSVDVDYFHFAATLKYDHKSKGEIFTTNLKGVENSLTIFSKNSSSLSRFFFISTAYSCGKIDGVFKEKFYDNEDISSFRNYYELSKRYAENIVRKFIEEKGVQAYILRLSQVVGRKEDGVTKTDYGIFDFSKRIFNIASRYPNRTVRVRVDTKGTQNLIPVDTTVFYLKKTLESDNVPVILNFNSKKSTENRVIIETINELLPVNIVPDKDIKDEEMDSVERLIAIGMSFTGGYIDTNLKFETTERDKIIPTNGYEISDEAVNKMIRYFIKTLDHDKKVAAK